MWPTVLTASIVAVIFLAIVVTGIRNRLKGKGGCSCGGGCTGCAMEGSCHPQKES